MMYIDAICKGMDDIPEVDQSIVKMYTNYTKKMGWKVYGNYY